MKNSSKQKSRLLDLFQTIFTEKNIFFELSDSTEFEKEWKNIKNLSHHIQEKTIILLANELVKKKKNIISKTPRYTFGPEIESDGSICYWASDDGIEWIKRRILSDENLQDDDPTQTRQNPL